MNTPCEIIQDLLPLYAEQMASDASAQMVEVHLAHCAACNNVLKASKAQIQAPQCNLKPLRKIRLDIGKKRLLSVLLAASVLAIILLSTFSFLTAPQTFTYTQDLLEVVEFANGEALVVFDPRVTGYKATQYTHPDGRVHIDISAWTTILGRFIDTGAQSYRIAQSADVVYYCSANLRTEDKVIWSRTQPDSGSVMTLASLSFSYYALIAAGALLLFGIVLIALRKQPRKAGVVWKFFAVPLSYIGAHLCIKGTVTISHFPKRDFFWIAITMVFWYIAALTAYTLFRSFRESRRCLPK
ncbi:MAG: zf-HC2 domain-containing protein [Oscillospiraceae bacterium]|jgi:hypothetical protein|nr:zf-HC2 domain-containing protein [Oscillospiraceae bacterium]